MTPLSSPSFRFADVFAGIGGMRLAAEALRGRCVFSSEIDRFAVRTYRTNFGELPAGDIQQVESSLISDFDILLAGFPCQPFSYAGKRRGLTDVRGNLFLELLRLLQDKRPQAFLFENVKGLVSHEKGQTLNYIEHYLSASGYSYSWRLLNSAHFGLPQNRLRWYCVGFRETIPFVFPQETPSSQTLGDILDSDLHSPKLSLHPIWKARITRHFLEQNSNGEIRVAHPDFSFAENSKRSAFPVFSYLNKENNLRFHLGDRKKTQVQEGFFTSQKSLAPTLIAGRVPKLWDLQRKLSVRECARLQGFPDQYVFPVSRSQSYKQLGNAVSIPVIKALLQSILIALSSQSQRTADQFLE